MLNGMAMHMIGTREAAQLLHVDRSVLIKRVAAGTLHPVHRLPGTTGAYLFDRADIEALAAEARS